MRIFWRFRSRFLRLEDVSSYVYGRRMPKNLHTTEVIISGLRSKLKKITGRHEVIKRVRNYGYKIEDGVWDDLFNNEV